ncbi:3-deoxy-D-manno-octulosonic-acid transferase [Paracoccus isoporae]|uniref:3-deoxy-D-manno-octulosonic acid transferase n=1 Tax=Paracoccus isoporae TaxID=591205 RepID=A0A1G6UIY7_9RHOB|nr:glycosyltransferase N-terminal domain-containing protein [Paracoccus isoporae]SDD40537.1 3-deoxy-D-manno-octulosonic-acid transferase [Paracoccus isoporae]
MPGGGDGGVMGWLRGILSPATPAPQMPLPDLPLPNGDGPLIWMRIGAGYDQSDISAEQVPAPLIQLLAQIRRRGMQVALSRAVGGPAELGTRGVSSIADPPLTATRIRAHLDALNPAAILLIGTDLPRPLIEIAASRDIPVILAEARLAGSRRNLPLPKLARRSAITLLTRLLLPDPISRTAALELGASPEHVEICGPITPAREPLKHNEAEREALAEAFQGRQIWLAVHITEAEEQAVIDAHLALLLYSHRAMLIVMPDDPRRAEAMAARMEAAGLVVAQRSLDEDPTDEVSVYLADDSYELGLWYRLAPLCFTGTTLAGPTDAARDPYEAASLGSALMHGPRDGAYAVEWAQLDGAAAARQVGDAGGLAGAVVTLLAPDQAAMMATNAWAVATGGAGAASRIAQVMAEILDEKDLTA